MEVLLVQEGSESGDRFVFLIESNYAAKIHEVSTLAQAHKYLRSHPNKVELIIVDHVSVEMEELKAFWKDVMEIPSIYCLDPNASDAEEISKIDGTFRTVDRNQLVENVRSAIEDFREMGLLGGQKKQEDPQVRIRTRLLLSVGPLKGDVYIRLSSDKFVKLFHKGDVFDQSDHEKYTVKKGVEYLYIRKEQCDEFLNKLSGELQKKLSQKRPLSVEESAVLGTSVLEGVQELIHQVGFSKEVQEVVKASIQVSLKSIGKDPQLSDFVKKLQEMEGEYIAKHSILCGYLACGIAVQLQWGSGPTFHKLTLASFLHDLTLTNSKLAAIKTLQELEEKKDQFTSQEIKDYKEHPLKAADMTLKVSEVPPDVDTIIRQHHERPDGSGFPGSLEHKYIAPLASLFIVAHDLADYTLAEGKNFNVEVFLQGVRDIYKSSYFKKILNCLEVLRKF